MTTETELPPLPDYVKCINRTMQANLARSWCGRSLFGEFAFQGLDHAAENNLQHGRLLPCPDCIDAAFAALRANGLPNEKPPPTP